MVAPAAPAAGRARETKRGRAIALQVALFAWAIVACALPLLDLYTDVRVLIEVWGAWPMWPLLASILAPFVASAFLAAGGAAAYLARGGRIPSPLRLRWVWPAPKANSPGIETTESWGVRLSAAAVGVVALPVGILWVLVLDALAVVEKFGFYLVTGERLLSLGGYQESRGALELILESIPQAVFQTALYLLGSSRATRVYIDEEIFLQSIGLSLLSVVAQYCLTLWEAFDERRSFFAVFAGRFQGARGFSTVQTDGADASRRDSGFDSGRKEAEEEKQLAGEVEK